MSTVDNKPAPDVMRKALDARQRVVIEWGERCFGVDHMRDKIVRAARFFEEAAELVQSIGLPRDHAMRAFDHVYSREAGKPAQEAGGVANTLMALCGALDLSFDGCQQAEIARCLAKDPSHFAKRNEAKLREVDASAPVPPPDGAVAQGWMPWRNGGFAHALFMVEPSDKIKQSLSETGGWQIVPVEIRKRSSSGDRPPPPSAPVSASVTLIESLARLQRRLMSYCNHANAGHMPSDAREFARRIQLGFLAAYEEAGVTPPTIEPETHAEYMASLLAPAVGVTREVIARAIERLVVEQIDKNGTLDYSNECLHAADAILALPPSPVQDARAAGEPIKPYDAGLLNDFGGGNVQWWQDYIRELLRDAYDHYVEQSASQQDAVREAAIEDGVAVLEALQAHAKRTGAISARITTFDDAIAAIRVLSRQSPPAVSRPDHEGQP